MKFEIENGKYVGSVEWQEPGRVALDIEDPKDRRFFERYFAEEDAFMTGPVESAGLAHERRDSSERAFEHAAFRLAAYDYKIRRDGDRRGAHSRGA